MGKDYQKRYNERAKYLAEVQYRNSIVAGRKDYDFTQHLAPELRGTYQGQVLIKKWRWECFMPGYLDKLEFEVANLAELAAWEKNDDDRFRKRNRLPPSAETRRVAIEAKRAAQTAAKDEPPSLPALPPDNPAALQKAEPLQRDEITLFGSTRPIKQVVSLEDKKKND